MKIVKIVSGGQTGADRGGWEAAIYCELPIGGWVQRGRRAEDGAIPEKYQGLQETRSADYLVRTEANVFDSDATVVFCYGKPTGGNLKTVKFAAKHLRPCLAVDLNNPRQEATRAVVEWLAGITDPGQGVLNVAGSRASKHAGIEAAVKALMVDVVSQINNRQLYPLP